MANVAVRAHCDWLFFLLFLLQGRSKFFGRESAAGARRRLRRENEDNATRNLNADTTTASNSIEGNKHSGEHGSEHHSAQPVLSK